MPADPLWIIEPDPGAEPLDFARLDAALAELLLALSQNRIDVSEKAAPPGADFRL
jgi:hypothetical protein